MTMTAQSHRDTKAAATEDLKDPEGYYDLTGVDENDRPPAIPPGEYEAVCVKAEFGPNKKKDDMITLHLRLEGNEEEEVNGRTVWYYIVLPRFVARFKAALMILNPDIDLRRVNPRDADTLFVNGRCSVKVRTSEFEGRETNNVQEIGPSREHSFFAGR